ncbi:MAG: Chaperone DnaJ domain protein [Chthoniobacter sp.]|jgi:curved DNA-binding protein|nr:Chaperone DnaJ domain protein [Chthoniobacter sp.]
MSVQYKDYYSTLGVAKNASHDEIRKAFRKLARVHHPDVAKDKKAAEAKFKEINEAYDVLGDAEKRQKYDTLGADWEQGGSRPPGPGRGRRGTGGGDPFGGATFGGTGFSDFFEQFFSGQAARGGADPFGNVGVPGENRRGGDLEADLLVSIEDALSGAKKKITLQRDASKRPETFEVRIPVGVREGQKIRLSGQGGSSSKGGAAGDLFLRVRFERHPDFRVEESDLIYDLEVPVARAVLGTEVEVPTPEGPIRLKIPPGSQPGRKLRLKGRGLPTSAGGRGDFLVKVGVTLPEAVAGEERALWEQLAKLGG